MLCTKVQSRTLSPRKIEIYSGFITKDDPRVGVGSNPGEQRKENATIHASIHNIQTRTYVSVSTSCSIRDVY
jgi:hypothetical protein